jgi:hypothetical protein
VRAIDVDAARSAVGRAAADLETDLHKLQAQLGEDWILSLSVQGGDSWLTAEKEDVTQRIEAADASVLCQAVKLLNEGGGRSGSARPLREDLESD